MKERLVVVSILGGLAVLLALGVVVLRFGRFDPSPPSLKSHPNPAIPGEILYFNPDGCIIRAAASGAWREQVYCLAEGRGFGPVLLTRIDAGTIAYLQPTREAAPGGLRYEVVEIDLSTRTTRPTGRILAGEQLKLESSAARTSPSGEAVTTGEKGEVVLVANGVRTEIADFDVADYRGPNPLSWSPDGQWILLQYYPRNGDRGVELWILSRDGRTKGTLATDAGGPPVGSWWIDGIGHWPKLEE